MDFEGFRVNHIIYELKQASRERERQRETERDRENMEGYIMGILKLLSMTLATNQIKDCERFCLNFEVEELLSGPQNRE